MRLSVARYLSAGTLSLRTALSQGLALPPEKISQVAGSPYGAGMAPYLPLLPLITDRHVDALTLAGTVEEVAEHAVALCNAGVDSIIARPVASDADANDKTILKLGTEVWPRVKAATRSS